MDNKDDMKTLLDRFMAGQTTPDEEDRLACYFRSGKAPSEWRDYREMFAYFDEGMPDGRYTKPNNRPRRRIAVALGVLAVAAAVALLLVMVLPQGGNGGMAPTPMASACKVVSPDTTVAEPLPDTVRDVPGPSELPRKRIIHKYKYSPEPPRGYYAEALTDTKTDTLESIDALVAEQISNMEQRQKALAVQTDMLARLREALLKEYIGSDLAADNEELY